MNIFAKTLSVILLAVITSILFEQTMEEYVPHSKNTEYIERIVCRPHPGNDKISSFKFRFKYIDRNHIKADIRVNFSKPVTDMWVHVKPYFRYNTYQRIAGYIWENPCDWFSGKKKSIFLDWTLGLALKSPDVQTNFNHTCPFSGSLYFKFDNMSVQQFAFPQLVPSGRYRLNMNVTESDRSKVLGGCVFYVSVSDHRVEGANCYVMVDLPVGNSKFIL